PLRGWPRRSLCLWTAAAALGPSLLSDCTREAHEGDLGSRRGLLRFWAAGIRMAPARDGPCLESALAAIEHSGSGPEQDRFGLNHFASTAREGGRRAWSSWRWQK